MNGPPLHRVRPALRPLEAYRVPPDPPPVKLDANESPWPLPHSLRQRMGEALAEVALHRYPDPRATALRQRLAERCGGAPQELVLGSGSDEIIALLMTALSEPPGGQSHATVLYPEPTFVMYRISALAHGLVPVGVELDPHWDLDLEAMLRALEQHQPNLVFLASPNNPTGNTFDPEKIRRLVQAAPDSLFVVDEAYAFFDRPADVDGPGGPGGTESGSDTPLGGRFLQSWCDTYPNLIALGTLSKVGLAAARVGWARMHRDLAREVDKARQPFNLSALAQEAARLALTEMAGALEGHIAAIVRDRQVLRRELAPHPELTVHPSSANFLLVRFEGNPDTLASALRKRHIGIKSFHRHGGRLAHHLRITVGTPDDNARLLDALPQALAECR